MTSLRYWMWLLLGVSLLAACENQTEPIDNPIPVDDDPAITIISPTNPRFSIQPGEQVQVTMQMADNEALRLLRITVEEFDPADALIGQGIAGEVDIKGNTFTYTFTATPVQTDKPPFHKLRYKFFVLDSKGAADSTFFWISLLPDSNDPQPYQLLTYTNDTIVNSLSDSLFGFNFTARRGTPVRPGENLDTLRLQMDIAENSGTGQGLWEPFLFSPNSEALGFDSVFVMTDSSRFNYEEATYTSIFEAFSSGEELLNETPVLKEGDYVIVRLVKTPRPQFAVMYIKEVFNDGPGIAISDYVVFDYKVSTP